MLAFTDNSGKKRSPMCNSKYHSTVQDCVAISVAMNVAGQIQSFTYHYHKLNFFSSKPIAQ